MSSSAATSAADSGAPAWSDPLNAEAEQQGKLRRYLCILPDYNAAEALQRRLEVRQQHLDEAARGKKAGRIELGGALLSKDWDELDDSGPPSALCGSCLIVLAENITEARERIARDPYSKANVWDPAQIQVYPFLQAAQPQRG
ncbi:hypothetical protein K437DRAFT_258196 [Tilletiaria anomala UBC 951]|uniref:YCII-related domain-containing protein n=1 Tax=Tilletiaria anomala (strain ATCC 24038 / CBS 436.72 / UBC 951) TaxID=1037660 RepID=A0A066VJC9_TILAU|nr:uncharacterized protein K437DRAFT_258196 [Tilletiaria anomala UBC 951]KDN41601.1 hypothetical protein K437DRAFT_258196 [Tilletiaria anomala UBC 951]